MINFVRSRVFFFILTGVAVLVTVAAMLIPPRLPWGLEFSSGAAMDVEFVDPNRTITDQEVRERLEAAGFQGTTVQSTGTNSFFIRTARVEDNLDTILEQNFTRVRVNHLSDAEDLAAVVSFRDPVPADLVKSSFGQDVKGLVVSRVGTGEFFVSAQDMSDSKLKEVLAALEKRYGSIEATAYAAQEDMALVLDFGPGVAVTDFQEALKGLEGKFEQLPAGQNSYLLVGTELTEQSKGSLVAKLEEKFGRVRQTSYDAPEDMALRLTFDKAPPAQEIRNELLTQSIFSALVLPSGEKSFVLVGKGVTREQQDKIATTLRAKFGELQREAFDFNKGVAATFDFGQTATLESVRQAVLRTEPTAVAASLNEQTFFLGGKNIPAEKRDALVSSLEGSFGPAKRSNFDYSKAVASQVRFKDPIQLADVVGSLSVIPVTEAVGNRATVKSIGPNNFLVVGASLPTDKQEEVLNAIRDRVGAFEKGAFDKPEDLNLVLDFGQPVNTVDLRAEVGRVAPDKVSVESVGGNNFFLAATAVAAGEREAVLKAAEDKFGPATRTTYETAEDLALALKFERDTTVGQVRSEVDNQQVTGLVVAPAGNNRFIVAGKKISAEKKDAFLKGLQDRFGPVQSEQLDLNQGMAVTLDFGLTPELSSIRAEVNKVAGTGVQVEPLGAKGFFLGAKGLPKAKQDEVVKALETRFGPARRGQLNPQEDMAAIVRITDTARVTQAVNSSLVVEKLGPNRFLVGGQDLGSDKRQQALSALQSGISPIEQSSFDFSVGLAGFFTFAEPVTAEQIKGKLEPFGYGNMVVEPRGGNEYYIRSDRPSADQKNKIVRALESAFGPVNRTTLGFSFVDAQIARRSVVNTFIAVAASSVGILLYVWWAFRNAPKPFRFGLVTVLTLIHDVVIVIGAFGIMAKFTSVEVDSLMIVGLLAVIGASVNNTIVVLDRVRENLVKFPNRTFEQTVNFSLNETLTRNLNTTIAVVLAIMAVLLFGGATIANFMLVLLIGILAGLYSSLVLAPNLLVSWEKGEFRLRPKAKRIVPAGS